MKKLLSLPPNLTAYFHDVTSLNRDEYFCSHDPIGHKLGSGGGTTALLQACYAAEGKGKDFDSWLSLERRLLLHAGGQGRRVPAYAPSGKILTPIPVFRWERGQRLSQTLLSLQVPLYEKIMQKASASLRTMIVSGDVLIRATEPLQEIPEADVVCYGLWLGAETATNHGVFVSSRKSPNVLKCMLQKPSVETLSKLEIDHYYLTDIGVWLLSDRAVKVLMKHSLENGELKEYDLYGEFGCALGTDPTLKDKEVGELSVAILPLPGGEFYHFGTSHEILSSTLALQNLVSDQRQIMHHSRKPHPAMFIQNADTRIRITAENRNLWIENSMVGEGWTLSHENIITGVPENNWTLKLEPGQCIDIVPVGERGYALRPYGYNDRFAGAEQFEKRFPVTESIDEAGLILSYMLGQDNRGKVLFEKAEKLSADDLNNHANLQRLEAQRRRFRHGDWSKLAENYRHSVFYQLDLDDAARDFAAGHIALPAALPETEPLMTRIHDAMFRSETLSLGGKDGSAEEHEAFNLLSQGLTADVAPAHPCLSVCTDQIVWGRSPVRIDIAGGWSDTPPYCLIEGGRVINIAIELNGQQPLQVYVKPSKELQVTLRSIDLGASETVKTFEELADFRHVGSPFSIPKAALALAGFLPRFCTEHYATLESQLKDFGCGLEVTLLSAIPAGSGLGTSSILSSTVLGALSDFCGLNWDKNEIGHRTLVLEQLLSTGGGWQDQFGGLLHGVKMLETQPGFNQSPVVRWLPGDLWTSPEYRACHLLYYTGITRTAKHILGEIVKRMFLNQHEQLDLLREMKAHTTEMYEAIQRASFDRLGQLVRRTWQQNCLLDSGTNPDEVKELTRRIDDLCLGYKLPGAGGGGYLYMMAKDQEAAARIRAILKEHPTRPNARFVDMTLSQTGLQVSRS